MKDKILTFISTDGMMPGNVFYYLAFSLFLVYKLVRLSLLAAYISQTISLAANGCMVLLLLAHCFGGLATLLTGYYSGYSTILVVVLLIYSANIHFDYIYRIGE